MASAPSLLLATIAAVALLLFLILYLRLHAFLALLISSFALGLMTGMPASQALASIQFGFGDALGFIAVVVALGAMIGRFLEHWVGSASRGLAAGEVRAQAHTLGAAKRFFSCRIADLLRGRVHYSGASRLEPGTGIEAQPALLRSADCLRSHCCARYGSTASSSRSRRSTFSRRSRQDDSAGDCDLDSDGNRGRNHVRFVDFKSCFCSGTRNGFEGFSNRASGEPSWRSTSISNAAAAGHSHLRRRLRESCESEG